MSKRLAIIGLGILFLVGLLWTRDQDSQEKSVSRIKASAVSAPVETESLSSASKAPPAQPKPQLKRIRTKLKFNLGSLLHLNPGILKENPGIDLKNLKPEDVANLRIPRGTSLMLLRDANCRRNEVVDFGRISDSELEDSLTRGQSQAFVSFTTEKVQTIAEMSAAAESEECILGVFPNGAISSLRLPADAKDLKKFLPPGVENPPQIFDSKQILYEGRDTILKSIAEGDPQPIKVYMTGLPADLIGVQGPVNPSEAIATGVTFVQGAGQLYALPLPTNMSPSQELATLNNGIIEAVNQGAGVILVPHIDPSVYLAASQYAAAHGATLYLVPPDAKIPPQFIDQRQPASSP